MADYCLETTDLTHSFSSTETVLNGINLKVKEGSIYGFLGPNGAGKTTTLRLILGLLRKQQGTITVFGKSFHDHRLEILKNVGSLIESPSLYGHLTAHENLLLFQKIFQCPKSNITEVLERVGLASTGTKKASQFSLGMKQRLGIAVALLHKPEFLILDEPTNGLDPNSMIEVRELLKKLNHEFGTTILISSHLLAEIEKLVMDVGIINKGNLVFQGTLPELKSKQQGASFIAIATNDNSAAIQVLNKLGITATIEPEKLIIPVVSRVEMADINHELVTQGIGVYEITSIKNDLETIFMDLINN
ncbi:MAG: ABC transporter ATP-binding protein [Cyclobacteriaceae bacterium]|nr:ABC transporter ATP-binding protein [Cyclobacteriaceae bacterium]